MSPENAPWIDVSDDWLDSSYSSDHEIEKLQRFLDRKVKAEAIRKHLLAEGIGKPGEVKIRKISIRNYKRRCVIEAILNVTGQAWKVKDEATGLFVENNDPIVIKTGTVKMIRAIEKDDYGDIYAADFGKMGVGTARLPWPFADEYYKRVIPFLRRIGVKSIEIMPATEADNSHSEEGRLLGAYIWCKYGYINGLINKETGQVERRINHTIDEFLKYLKEHRKVRLTDEETSSIKALTRMIDMAEHDIYRNGKWLKVGKDFLLGDNGAGKYTRDVMWQGVIPDINDLGSKEMEELTRRLARP